MDLDDASFFSSSRASTSTASSSRTVRPRHYVYSDYNSLQHDEAYLAETRTSYAQSADAYDGSIYMPPPHTHAHHHHSSHGPPVPPARSSSLAHSHSHPEIASRVPTLQVTQATPTKRNVRRRSAGATSTSSGVSNQQGGSPRPRGSGGRKGKAAAGTGTLEVDIAGDGDDDEEQDDEAKRVVQAKEARAREGNRLRQARKRARDKKAKEEAIAAGLPPPGPAPSSLTSSAPLLNPPARTLSQPNLFPPDPSPTPSNYSSLPLSSAFYNLSPGASVVLDSGQSSPNALFSPTVSTPGMGYTSSSGELVMFGSTSALPLTDTSGSNASLPGIVAVAEQRASRRGGKGKARAVSNASAPGMRPAVVPVLAPVVIHKKSGPSPAKRRKSEPEPEEFRTNKEKRNSREVVDQMGLGMIMSEAEWLAMEVAERPRYRRTASDGVTLPNTANAGLRGAEEGGRSPTPPPVPTLPDEYRQPRAQAPSSVPLSASTLSSSATSPIPPPLSLPPFLHQVQQPSPMANFFSSTMVLAVTSNEVLMNSLRGTIGVSEADIRGMGSELAGVFDRWLMQRAVERVNLNEASDENADEPMPQHIPLPSSPPTQQRPTSFFTPQHPRPSSRRALNPSATQPLFHTSPPASAIPMSFTSSRPSSVTSSDSPLSAQPAAYYSQGPAVPQAPAPDTTLASGANHSRARSLSSAGMRARGLVLVPASAGGNDSGATALQESDTSVSLSTSTTSPGGSSNLQTPSTGQGGFPTHDQMAEMGFFVGQGDAGRAGAGHWRSATDPTHRQSQRAYTTFSPQGQVAGSGWIKPGGMADVDQTEMVAPASNREPVSAPRPRAQFVPPPAFTTPSSSRRAGGPQDAMMPFTPATPVPVRGGQQPGRDVGHSVGHDMRGVEGQMMPMWYNPSFQVGSNGGAGGGVPDGA